MVDVLIPKKERNKNSLPVNHKAVVSILGEGKHNAITSTDIIRLTEVKDQREVFEIIEQLINKYGYVIGSSRTGKHKGYYLIADKKELIDTLYSYNAQIQSMMKRHRNLQKNYANKGD